MAKDVGSAARTRVPIPLRDQLWLLMDRPDNLMYINAIVWFSEVPDWDEMRKTISERIVARYPVFSRKAVGSGRSWFWEDMPDFDIEDHITEGRLPGDGSRAEAEAYISEKISEPLPWDRPLWAMEFLENYRSRSFGGRSGALILFRVQHGLVDGVRLTQLILSCCDHEDGADPPSVGMNLGALEGGVLGQAKRFGREVAFDSVDLARGIGGAWLRWPKTAVQLASDQVAPGGSLWRAPTRFVETMAGMYDEHNKSANTFRALFRMVLEPPSPKLAWKGKAGVAKRVSWISGLDLDAVKRVAAAHESTVTAVILAAVSRGLTDYLREHGDTPVRDINLLVPVSLAPFDAEPSPELGNHVTLVMIRLPLGVDDIGALLDEITTMMARVRNSYEPHVTFATIIGVAAVPKPIGKWFIDFFANKGVGQLTSVPGPSRKVTLGGTPVDGILGWVPMSGDQSLGVCIFSYDGSLAIGFTSDAGLVPDPALMAELVEQRFADYEEW